MSTKTVKTPVGKTVTWSVTLEGYIPQRGSYVMGNNPVNLNINLVSYVDAPFTIEALDDGGVQGIDTTKNVQYNKNNTGWVTATSNSIDFSEGDVIQFKAEYDSFQYNNWLFNEHARINVYGNIGSLLDPVNYSTITTYQSNYTFARFFSHVNVVDASNLILPATTLVEGCYNELFSDCTSLIAVPALPATTLADICYSRMFAGCTALTTAPTLPATTLAKFCYDSMFEGCTSLVTPPALPVTTLADSCYVGMFRGCTSLTTTPTLPATTLVNQCYAYMFSNCTALTTAPTLPANTLADYCYSGMFDGCTSLTSAPALPVTTLARHCYSNMFSGCTSLTTAPTLPANTLADSCYDSMFEGCTSLTTAPSLPANVLANSCYRWMFAGCTALTTAPELPAEILVPYCYMQMFQGCSNLNYIKCLAHDISANYCRSSWTDGVAPTGTFVRYFYNNDWPTGISGIPVGWVVETVGIEQHTVTINPTPANATVMINGVEQSSIHDWYGTSFNWSVSAPHYVTQSGTKTITGNETMNVNLVMEQFTFTINPTPADAVVTINGQQRTSITADYGTTINWNVSKAHYVTQSGTLVLNQDVTLPVTLALEQHTFTIVPTPADAVVTINGQQRTSITADYGTNISWSVSKAHYVTQSNTFVLSRDSTLPVSLALEQHTFTIVPTPADAIVTINGQQRTSITADYGTTINWSVSGEGYIPQRGSELLEQNKSINVVLVSGEDYPLTFDIVSPGTIHWSADYSDGELYRTIYYKINDGDWTAMPSDHGGTTINVVEGDQVSLKGNNVNYFEDFRVTTTTPVSYRRGRCYFGGSAMFNVYGNVLSMSYSDDFINRKQLFDRNLAYLFRGANIIDASGLKLTANTLPVYSWTPSTTGVTVYTGCYEEMFIGCAYLTKAPALPAMNLEKKCYMSMFEGCTSLTTAPALPATTLANECYHSMFKNCTSLTSSPDLFASQLEYLSYMYMFCGCSNLNQINCLATNLYDSTYGSLATQYWVSGVADSGTFIANPNVNWSTGNDGIPTGWIMNDHAFVISPNPLDATVIINGIERNFIVADYGTTINWSVSREGYTPQSGTNVFNTNTFLPISLVKNRYTLTINPTPANAIVEINGVRRRSITDYYGTGVYVQVYVNGSEDYITHSQIINISDDETINIELEQYAKDDYLTFDIISNGTVEWKRSWWSGFGIEYKKNDGEWTVFNADDVVDVVSGDKMYFRGNYENYMILTWRPSLQLYTEQGHMHFGGTALFNVSGNIRSMCYNDDYSGYRSSYYVPFLFEDSNVVDASKLLLPMSSLPSPIHYRATGGAETYLGCYKGMFGGCKNLIAAPALPATTLARYCYCYMFDECEKLLYAPVLSVNRLEYYCYRYMFEGCTSLNYIKCLATSYSSSDMFTEDWVNGVASSGIFVKNPSMSSWPTGVSGIPTGWTVIDAT